MIFIKKIFLLVIMVLFVFDAMGKLNIQLRNENYENISWHLSVENESVDNGYAYIQTKKIMKSNHFYDFSLGGISLMMNDLKVSDPKIFDQLLPDVNDLFEKQKKYKFYSISFLGSMSLLTANVCVFAIDKSPMLSTLLYASGVGFLYLTVFSYIKMSENIIGDFHIQKFINHHNEINKDKIQLSIFSPSGQLGLFTAFNF